MNSAVEWPLNMLPLRFAMEHIEIDGTTIHKGDPILIGYAAIARDTNMHGETAAKCDITRITRSI